MKNYFTTLIFMFIGLVAFAQKPYVVYETSNYKGLRNSSASIKCLVGNVADVKKADQLKTLGLSYTGVMKFDYNETLNSKNEREFTIIMEDRKEPIYFQNFLVKLGVEELFINKELVKTIDYITYYNKQLEKSKVKSK